MPGKDGTGPLGQGSLTGRGFGNCLAYGIPAIAGAIAGFGFAYGRGRARGRGRGFGRGFGWGSFLPADLPPISQENELTALKEQSKVLEDGLKKIQERISQIEQQNN